ncbi:fumarate hydratase subunit beta [Caldanaerobius fijiensis DSM 17918]|uniref:Fumarate hydratase subunit beta n=1 Tax=Caldanaerobius fijiensis DSM 17918 TaxID=1121256 RepID=A0A1M4X4D6_9THEO|nr:fumarate hydratase subunit beta [Caldanaerobius fijiensis DSM 17918]
MRLATPLTLETVKDLRAGQKVYITGTIYTARDAAHKRMIEAIKDGKPLPINIKDQVLYYVGPCPAKPGHVIGSCGPTTSGRVDVYTPQLLSMGLKGMIGKGERSREVVDAMIRYGAVYFAAVGGAGALLSQRVKSAKVAAYPELGPEAIYELYVEDFPAIVAIDCHGNSLFRTFVE